MPPNFKTLKGNVITGPSSVTPPTFYTPLKQVQKHTHIPTDRDTALWGSDSQFLSQGILEVLGWSLMT